jgi:hypothetical protein
VVADDVQVEQIVMRCPAPYSVKLHDDVEGVARPPAG